MNMICSSVYLIWIMYPLFFHFVLMCVNFTKWNIRRDTTQLHHYHSHSICHSMNWIELWAKKYTSILKTNTCTRNECHGRRTYAPFLCAYSLCYVSFLRAIVKVCWKGKRFEKWKKHFIWKAKNVLHAHTIGHCIMVISMPLHTYDKFPIAVWWGAFTFLQTKSGNVCSIPFHSCSHKIKMIKTFSLMIYIFIYWGQREKNERKTRN